MEIDYNMLVQNHVNYNMLYKKITIQGGGAKVKNLTFQCGGEEFKSPHLQPRLPWLFRCPNQVAQVAKPTRLPNLGYFVQFRGLGLA